VILKSIDERCGGYVFVAIVHQCHLALEVADVVLQALLWFNPHREEMVTIPLELSPRSELAVASSKVGITNFLGKWSVVISSDSVKSQGFNR